MITQRKTLAVFGALVLTTSASAALAQGATTDPATSTAIPADDDNGDEGMFGLLGLLGLAGLLGLKRRDRDRDQYRNTTTSTAGRS